MDTIRGMITGPYDIEADLTCHGMIIAGATLKTDRTLILHGMITGNLEVEAGAKAEIHGMVNGRVRNRGAHVVIYGWVDEVEDLDPALPTTIAVGGGVRGR